MRGPSPLYIEERHRALGRDATFTWSRALTHPPRCNRTRHRGRHLVSDFVGAAILVSWGPPSWTGSRGGRHLGSDVVTSLTLNWGLYYSYNVRQRLRRACASVHFQYSIDGSGLSSITAFMLNGLVLCLRTQTTTWKKALLYISLYKQTYLANLLSCLTLWFAWLFQSNNIYCDDQAA